jgi:hypothetical protein
MNQQQLITQIESKMLEIKQQISNHENLLKSLIKELTQIKTTMKKSNKINAVNSEINK